LEASFCIDAVEQTIARYGCLQIFNSDQGSQFTNTEFTSVQTNNGISISIDGKGSWRDNVFVERFWRTIKYEGVYLHAHESVGEARRSIGRYLAFYNARRPHTALDAISWARAHNPRANYSSSGVHCKSMLDREIGFAT
jgi:putative transposase